MLVAKKQNWSTKEVQIVLNRLGFKKTFFYILVTGTNGKGSTVAHIHSALSRFFKVGRYTSPHLVQETERIHIDCEIPEKKLNRLKEEILSVSEDLQISYFELMTAAAFLYFFEKEVDIVVAEVGMGGRLDATNSIPADIAVFTSLALDHTRHLGKTTKEIMKEKLAIVRKNTNYVGISAPIRGTFYGRDYKVVKFSTHMSGSEAKIAGPGYVWEGFTPLIGTFQKKNIAHAVEVVRRFLPPADIDFSDVCWPGRFEFFGTAVLDGAHNPAAMREVLRTVKILDLNLKPVVAFMRDKNWKKMIIQLAELGEIEFFELPMDRALTWKEFFEFCQKKKIKCKPWSGDWESRLFTGSLYFIGYLKRSLKN